MDVRPVITGTVSAADALKTISCFFQKEWPITSEDEVIVEKITCGYSSNVHVVRRSTPAMQEPGAVILRQTSAAFGGDAMWRLSREEESIVYFEMSRRGWGPKLFGVDSGIRVEEFIESRTLTPDDCEDPLILRSIARCYARIHSLDFPFSKSKLSLCFENLKADIADVKGQEVGIRMSVLAAGHPDSEFVANNFFSIDFLSETMWLNAVTEKFACKKCLIHSDSNFLNVLVRDDAAHEDRVVLIDYECMMYNYRAQDIGAHFVNRMIRWNGKENKLSGAPFPDEEKRRDFCQLYLEELQERDPENTDSLEQVIIEGEIGALSYTLSIALIQVKYLDHFIEEPSFLSTIRLAMEVYPRLKKAFIAKHMCVHDG